MSYVELNVLVKTTKPLGSFRRRKAFSRSPNCTTILSPPLRRHTWRCSSAVESMTVQRLAESGHKTGCSVQARSVRAKSANCNTWPLHSGYDFSDACTQRSRNSEFTNFAILSCNIEKKLAEIRHFLHVLRNFRFTRSKVFRIFAN